MFNIDIPKSDIVALDLDKTNPIKQKECNDIAKMAMKNSKNNIIIYEFSRI